MGRRLLRSKGQERKMSSMKWPKKSRQLTDKFAYKSHPIHFHKSEKCQPLEVQIVWLYTVEMYFTCTWLFGLLCNMQ
jgi:hypothetical protein